jgi:two-component system, chemotaxis family, protein-glutamate methylesterase/glutaminase
MAKRDIVVIGASAGGVSALKRLCVLLPANFDAALFVVLHIGPRASILDKVLEKSSANPVEFARDGQEFHSGHIYLAPPDMHLLIRDGRTHLRHGARENLARPAIDPLFRSAAVSYGRRVIGVVLTGALGDGSIGLRAIKLCGGIGLVQDPAEAENPEMPEAAINTAAPDHIAPIGELAKILIRRVAEEAEAQSTQCPDDIRVEADFAFGNVEHMPMDKIPGDRSVYSCPECNGALWEIKDGELAHYRCHVGHVFSAESMADSNGEQLERALWSALRILEERTELVRSLATRAKAGTHLLTAERYDSRMRELEQQAELIRGLMRQTKPAKPRARGRGAAAR